MLVMKMKIGVCFTFVCFFACVFVKYVFDLFAKYISYLPLQTRTQNDFSYESVEHTFF